MANWELIRQEFINGNQPIRELARLHGVSENTALTRASEGEWTRLREEYRSKASRDAQGNDLSGQLRTLNRKDSEGIERVRVQALALLDEDPSASALKTIAQCLEIVQRVSRFALGVALVQPTMTPDSNRQLRDLSNSELMQRLLFHPSVMARIVSSGRNPSDLSDDEILEIAGADLG